MSEEYQILHNWVTEDEIDAIDFICKQCRHSLEEHDIKGCNKGVISTCECNHFVLDTQQIQNVKNELNEIGELMLANYKKAKELDEHHE